MSTNTYGDISPRTAAKAAKKLLSRGQHLMVLERFGQIDPLGKNKTDSVKWRRYESLARATSPLAEGVAPTGKRLTKTDVNATLEQYGDVVEITDKVIDTHEDPVLNAAVEVMGEQAAETVEVIRFNEIKGGSNVVYAGAVTSRASVDSAITVAALNLVYRSFKRNKAREITNIISATAKIATEPVGMAFFALGHTDLDADIKKLTGFVPVEQYSNHMNALPGEIGKVGNFRFVLTALFNPWSASGASGTTYLSNGAEVTVNAQCDVYPVLCIARDAYGIVPLQGANAITPAVKNPEVSVADPLAQIGIVSWKTYQAAAILNQSWLIRIECAATAVPA